MASLMVAGNTVVSALGQSASPRLAYYYASGDKNAFVILLLKLLALGILLGITGVIITHVAGYQLLSIIYTKEYAKYTNVFFWVSIASSFNYVASFLGYGMTAARYFKTQLPLMLVAVSVTVMACAIYIPTQGICGAAIALVINALALVLGSIFICIHAIHNCK
jgi:O-antigen/teichoic acid export membrane protein